MTNAILDRSLPAYQQIQHLRPSINYYLQRLLRQNLNRLKSVVAPGAAIVADAFRDLNGVVESLYLDPEKINNVVDELEKQALIHQKLISSGMIYQTVLQECEEKIYWLLGFKVIPTQESDNLLSRLKKRINSVDDSTSNY